MKRLVLVAVLAVAACGEVRVEEETRAPAPVAAATDAWIGQWPGVEGTFLKVEAGAAAGTYTLTQGTLDGVNTYQGAADGTVIAFERNGIRETVRAGSGADTGLKWLAEKTDCLVIKDGEGYCR